VVQCIHLSLSAKQRSREAEKQRNGGADTKKFMNKYISKKNIEDIV
jgi:hypothetical protein